MIKLSSLALSAVLGLAGLSASVSAQAHPYESVSVGVPVAAPLGIVPAYYRPYYREHGPYGRVGYGYGRFYRHWHRC
jgi:hypothetical protein